MIQNVTPQRMRTLIKAGARVELIDVRTPTEFAQGHAVGARNIPLDELNPQVVVAERDAPADCPIYLICQSGGRSAQACLRFHAAGHFDVRNVAGGTTAWIATGLPVESDGASLPDCCR